MFSSRVFWKLLAAMVGLYVLAGLVLGTVAMYGFKDTFNGWTYLLAGILGLVLGTVLAHLAVELALEARARLARLEGEGRLRARARRIRTGSNRRLRRGCVSRRRCGCEGRTRQGTSELVASRRHQAASALK